MLALGRVIVRQLELAQPGDVLARWMAHHLAELIKTAESSEGAAKQDAEDRAVDLILKLWTNRRVLPVPADPLSGYRDAIRILSRLQPSADPWHRFRRASSDEELLHDMFGAMAQLIKCGLLLTRETDLREIDDIERAALSVEETYLLEIFEDWEPFFVSSASNDTETKILFHEIINGKSELEVESEDLLPADKQEAASPTVHRAAILKYAEVFQARLADLLEQWRRKTMLDNDKEDAPSREDDN